MRATTKENQRATPCWRKKRRAGNCGGHVKSRLSKAEGIVLTHARDWSDCLDSAGKEPVFVGRLRKDPSNSKAVWLWVVSDNLYKAAALNAIQIAEELDGFTR